MKTYRVFITTDGGMKNETIIEDQLRAIKSDWWYGTVDLDVRDSFLYKGEVGDEFHTGNAVIVHVEENSKVYMGA